MLGAGEFASVVPRSLGAGKEKEAEAIRAGSPGCKKPGALKQSQTPAFLLCKILPPTQIVGFIPRAQLYKGHHAFFFSSFLTSRRAGHLFSA